MVLQIRLFREATRADRTTERPGAIVNVRMTTKITGRGKALRTLRTFVRLVLQTSSQSVRLSQSSFGRSYLAVRQFVIVEIRRGRESLVADLTHVRFLARMDSTMRVERRRCRERLRAHVTGVWLLACVSSNVSSEKRRAIERLETRLALPHATFSLFVDTQRLQRLSRRVC